MALANYLRRRGATYSVRDPAEAKRKGAERVQEIRAWFDRLRSGAKLTSEMIEQECQDIAREALES